MACTRPLRGYRSPCGGVTVLSRGGKPGAEKTFAVPCGQCLSCRLTKTREWAIRGVHELQCPSGDLEPGTGSFVTLTFDDAALRKRGHTSVDVRDWQLFAKRLRKKLGPFRFLACGEYGSKNLRPHYHAILFGQDFSHDRSLWSRGAGSFPLYRSDDLEELWPFGFSTIGDVSFDTVAYVARYCLKKASPGSLRNVQYLRPQPSGRVIRVNPEFAVMSRRPGLGRSWFERFADELWPADRVVMDGREHPVPRYYSGLLEKAQPAEYAAVKNERLYRAREMEARFESPTEFARHLKARARVIEQNCEDNRCV